jgi:hypothetical protein
VWAAAVVHVIIIMMIMIMIIIYRVSSISNQTQGEGAAGPVLQSESLACVHAL